VVASRVQLRRANSRDSATRVRSHSSSATILKSPSRVITSEAWRTGSPLCPLVNVILRAAMPQPVCSPSLSYLVTCIYSVFLTVRAFYLSLSLSLSFPPLSLFLSCFALAHTHYVPPSHCRSSRAPLTAPSRRCRVALFVASSVSRIHTHTRQSPRLSVCRPFDLLLLLSLRIVLSICLSTFCLPFSCFVFFFQGPRGLLKFGCARSPAARTLDLCRVR